MKKTIVSIVIIILTISILATIWVCRSTSIETNYEYDSEHSYWFTCTAHYDDSWQRNVVNKIINIINIRDIPYRYITTEVHNNDRAVPRIETKEIIKEIETFNPLGKEEITVYEPGYESANMRLKYGMSKVMVKYVFKYYKNNNSGFQSFVIELDGKMELISAIIETKTDDKADPTIDNITDKVQNIIRLTNH